MSQRFLPSVIQDGCALILQGVTNEESSTDKAKEEKSEEKVSETFDKLTKKSCAPINFRCEVPLPPAGVGVGVDLPTLGLVHPRGGRSTGLRRALVLVWGLGQPGQQLACLSSHHRVLVPKGLSTKNVFEKPLRVSLSCHSGLSLV